MLHSEALEYSASKLNLTLHFPLALFIQFILDLKFLIFIVFLF